MIRQLLSLQRHESKVAVFEQNRQLTYKEITETADRLQGITGLENEKAVAIFLPDGGDFIAAFLGALSMGLTVFPLNILLTKTEVNKLLRQAGVETVITNSVYKDFFKTAAFESLNIVYIDELDKIDSALSKKTKAVKYFDINKTAVLLNTSGTTGKSKIVQLSERNIMTSAFGYLDKMAFSGNINDNRYILAVPFSSVYGIMIICACFICSFPIIVTGDSFTLDSLYAAAEKYKATHYEGSQTAILLMEKFADRHTSYDISRLKNFGFGGSKVSGATIKNLLSAYPKCSFCQGYGMTEAAPLIAKHPVYKPVLKTDSVGTAIKGLKIFIKTEDGITNKPDITGEIVVKGSNVMTGYLDNKKETDQVLKNGYLYTGDIGYIDSEGYLYILGRKNNIINARGFKVCAEEIEECLLSSGTVKDCVVYGKKDGFGNQIVCADIVKSNESVTEIDIIKHCEKHLAVYKQPHKILFRDKIDKNTAGKTKRKR